MENINFLDVGVFTKKMLPEPSDHMSAIWGARLVKNVISGWALTGTVRLQGDEIVWLNLDLTKRFTFPPHVWWFTSDKIRIEGPYHVWRDVVVLINGDKVGFKLKQPYFDTAVSIDLFFKIHGV